MYDLKTKVIYYQYVLILHVLNQCMTFDFKNKIHKRFKSCLKIHG